MGFGKHPSISFKKRIKQWGERGNALITGKETGVISRALYQVLILTGQMWATTSETGSSLPLGSRSVRMDQFCLIKKKTVTIPYRSQRAQMNSSQITPPRRDAKDRVESDRATAKTGGGPGQIPSAPPKDGQNNYQELPDEAFFSPSRPREEPGFSPTAVAVYIVVGLLLVAGIGGSIVGLSQKPLFGKHRVVSERSISTRTTFQTISGADWTMNIQMMLSPSVAYFKVHLSGKVPVKYQILGAHYKIGNGSVIPLKLPPTYLLFEPLSPGETSERTLWLGGSPVDSLTLDLRVDDGHEVRSDSLTFN